MQKGFRQRANKCSTFHEFLLPIENSLEKVNGKHVWVSNFLSIVDWLGRSSFYPLPGSVCFLALWQRWCIWLFVIFVTNLFGNLLCQGIRHSQLLCSIIIIFYWISGLSKKIVPMSCSNSLMCQLCRFKEMERRRQCLKVI